MYKYSWKTSRSHMHSVGGGEGRWQPQGRWRLSGWHRGGGSTTEQVEAAAEEERQDSVGGELGGSVCTGGRPEAHKLERLPAPSPAAPWPHQRLLLPGWPELVTPDRAVWVIA